MSNRRRYSEQTLSVMKRFFDALEVCRQNKLIKSYTEYCNDNNIDKAHLYVQRKELHRGFFEIGWAIPLVEKCGVSSLWLLTGKGLMFTQ